MYINLETNEISLEYPVPNIEQENVVGGTTNHVVDDSGDEMDISDPESPQMFPGTVIESQPKPADIGK